MHTISNYAAAATQSIVVLEMHKLNARCKIVLQMNDGMLEVYHAFKAGALYICSGVQSFPGIDMDCATAAYERRIKSTSPAIAPPKVIASKSDDHLVTGAIRNHIFETRTNFSYKEVIRKPSLFSRVVDYAAKQLKRLFSIN